MAERLVKILLSPKVWFFFLITGALFLNLGWNDIWIPNEGFYADSVRNMIKNGNVLDFFFNGEHRFNKPPVTYWLIGISCLIFGLNEWAIRLPMILLALGTSYITFSLGNMLGGKKMGYWSVLSLILSFQFLINTRYATPEIPLTFFFTLSLYFLFLAIERKNKPALWGFYFCTGFTTLTKGFPYLIVLGMIMLLYLVWRNNGKIKESLMELRFLRPLAGLILAAGIGGSWIAYSWFKFGETFLMVLRTETIDRAFLYHNNWLAEIFFFPLVMLWGFLPYSPVFFAALFTQIRQKEWIRLYALPLSWIAVILVVFTIARFKLPTYFIQAHPAMALITGGFLASFPLKPSRWLQLIIFILPGIVFTGISASLIILLKFSPVWFLLLLAPMISWLRLLRINKFRLSLALDVPPENTSWKLFPFTCFLVLFILFAGKVLPAVEKLRPYKEIGLIIQQEKIPESIPLKIEKRFLYNMPYYAERQVQRIPSQQITQLEQQNSLLLLATAEQKERFKDCKVLWRGCIYTGGSEAIFLVFFHRYLSYLKGDDRFFPEYVLLYTNPGVYSPKP